jgi:hypothetical protein
MEAKTLSLNEHEAIFFAKSSDADFSPENRRKNYEKIHLAAIPPLHPPEH